MALDRICRTCDVTNSAEIFKLNSYPKKYGGKMLLDLLMEVTKIDIGNEHKDKFPQFICCTCVRKLQNAYDFVIQAHEANKEMLDLLKGINTECLQEVPMDVSTEQLLEIKIEEEEDCCEESIPQNKTYLSDQSELDIKLDISDDQGYVNPKRDPLVINKILKNTAIEPKLIICDDSVSSSDLDELPLQLRIPKQKKLNILETMDDRKLPNTKQFIDTTCKRRFLSKDGLVTHFKTHEEEYMKKKVTATLPEARQVKEVDIKLCKPHGCKLIQCMICLKKFTKISDLRKHLNNHPVISSFTKRSNESLQDTANRLYVYFKDATEENLIKKIRQDLCDKMFDNFYTITNQSGYELSLSSSETESEAEPELESESESEEPKCKDSRKSYTCELCKKNYLRKYQLFEHQRYEHEWSEAVHVCRRCGARFVNKQLLEHHCETQCKNTHKRFICKKCPLRFRWKQNLLTHYIDHRKNKDTLQCSKCNRIYNDKKSLTVHMLKIHADDSKLLSCHWCSLRFYRRDYMLKHLKRHGIKEIDLPLAKTLVMATSKSNGDKIIQCKICNLQFERICDLKEHILLELKLNLSKHQSYESLTNYTITNESGFELHLDDSETDEEDSVETKQMSYKCEICQLQCRRKFEMFQHQRTMHRFERLPHSCEKCIFNCVSKDIIDHHRSTQCFNEQKQLSCAICSYKFMWPENLKRHMLLQHPNEIDSKNSSEESNINNSKKVVGEADATAQLQCPHCDKSYQLQGRLNNHIRDVHIEGDRKKKKENERKFLCSSCGMELQSAASLERHVRRHTGEKPFKCDMCDMAFPRHYEMLLHRRKHTGEKPYHCIVCGKDFPRSDKLRRHMLIHSDLKPHKCNECGKCYRQSRELKLHLLQHTGETHVECNVCGERFIQNVTLEKHRMMRGHF